VAGRRITRGGRLAIGLGVVGGLLALANAIVRYQRSGEIDWGRVALAIGVPSFIYAVVGASQRRDPQ